MTNQTKLLVFGQAGCVPCTVLKNALTAMVDDVKGLGAEFEYVDLTKGVRADRDELIEKYELTSTPVVVFERNGESIDSMRGYFNVNDVFDKLKDLGSASVESDPSQDI